MSTTGQLLPFPDDNRTVGKSLRSRPENCATETGHELPFGDWRQTASYTGGGHGDMHKNTLRADLCDSLLYSTQSCYIYDAYFFWFVSNISLWYRLII